MASTPPVGVLVEAAPSQVPLAIGSTGVPRQLERSIEAVGSVSLPGRPEGGTDLAPDFTHSDLVGDRMHARRHHPGRH